ncbi:uncharacterized protein LOC144869217 isoform X2 [Branchiostoma floridae x Branchiostoma japonicum]
MASNMDPKHGDKGETDHDASTPTSEADSGRGLSVAEVSSPEGDDQRHVAPNQDLDDTEPRMPIQTDTSQDGQGAVAQVPYNREIQLQEGESDELNDGDSPETTAKSVVQPSDTSKREQGEDATWQSVYHRNDNVLELLIVDLKSRKCKRERVANVSVNRVEAHQDGHLTVHASGSQSGDLRSFQGLSLSDQPVVLSLQRGSEVSPHLLEDIKKRGEGKSSHVQAFFSFVAEHLRDFEEVKDCYLLPLQNGLLISPHEVTRGNIQDSTVTVAQMTANGRGTIVLLNTTVSSDNTTPRYRPETQTTPGHFTYEGDKPLGAGVEGTVWNVKDKMSRDVFVVKEIPLTEFKPAAAAAFLKLTGCDQTCRPYGLVLDDEKECVLFLMEKVEGRTLGDILQDPNERLAIPLAVDLTIDLLKAVQYIHSKQLVHSDVAPRNVILFLEHTSTTGPRAILIDTTGAKRTSFHIDFAWDTADTIQLLNDMLLNDVPQSRLSKNYSPWKASANDKDGRTLGRLEDLVKEQADPRSRRAYTVQKLLQVMQEISEELKGLREPADIPDDLDASGIPSPPNFKFSS